MPCYGPDGPGTRTVVDTARVDKLTRIACELASRLQMSLGKDAFRKVSNETWRWWEEHQALDLQRATLKRKAEEKTVAKRVALSKLSPDEIRLLGLSK